MKGLQGADSRYLKLVAKPRHYAVHGGQNPTGTALMSKATSGVCGRPATEEERAMGNFYVNFTVKAEDPESVAQTPRRAGRNAFVSPNLSGYVVATDQAADKQDPRVIQQVGELLSGAFQTSVLAVLNHDDDILCYWLFENGSTTDEYNSGPGHFTGENLQPSGRDAQRLCSVFGRKDALGDIKDILMDQDFVFALDRHEALIDALDLPAASVGFGFSYLEAGDTPEGIHPASLIRTP